LFTNRYRIGAKLIPQATTARVVRILPEKALLDLNHSLAGKPPVVSLQIMTIENSDEKTPLP
jgi:FKBP-type peptidyl-prolyl cis-trans isomerase 2